MPLNEHSCMLCAEKKMGGSLSSDSVLNDVSCGTFDTLDINSINKVGGFKIFHRNEEQFGGFKNIGSYRRVLRVSSHQKGGATTGTPCVNTMVDVLGSYGLNLGNVPTSSAQSADGSINMQGVSSQNQNVLSQPVGIVSAMPNSATFPTSYMGANPAFKLH